MNPAPHSSKAGVLDTHAQMAPRVTLATPNPVANLQAMGRGLADRVHGAQALFRSILTAMSFPGRVQHLPADAMTGLEPPALPTGLCALLLTLLDAETSVHLHPVLAGAQACDYLRFHTGVRTVQDPGQAAFVAMHAAQATAPLWRQLNIGSDSQPQDGATLIVEVPALHEGGGGAGCTLVLNGPGIRRQARLAVAGLGADVWQARIALQADFPRGIDLLLCCGPHLVALPRSTQLALEG